jgi:hypothetical protein
MYTDGVLTQTDSSWYEALRIHKLCVFISKTIILSWKTEQKHTFIFLCVYFKAQTMSCNFLNDAYILLRVLWIISLLMKFYSVCEGSRGYSEIVNIRIEFPRQEQMQISLHISDCLLEYIKGYMIRIVQMDVRKLYRYDKLISSTESIDLIVGN